MSTESLLKTLENNIGLDFSLPEVDLDDLSTSNDPCYATDIAGNVIGLNLSGLSLREVPDMLSQFTYLETVRLFRNDLADLPLSWAHLTKLAHLYLAQNRFAELPRVIPQLRSLEVLALNGNHFVTLPFEISELNKLQTLGLSRNNFTTLPEFLGDMRSLRRLFLRKNSLTEFPAWITKLSDLEELNVSDNPIETLPNNLGNLSNLRLLSLSGTRLTDICGLMGELNKNLEELDLAGSLITYMPESISNLRSLKALTISGTRITHLPSAIGDLRELNTLNLSSLKLGEIPSDLFRLRNLRELNLSSTKVRSIPSEIGRLSELVNLDLSSMNVSSIPASIFSLSNLRRLNLAGNRLRELPPQIVQSELKIYWERTDKTEGIFLYGNPLESPPPEIVKKGTSAVHTYFRSLKGERKPIHEVKVLLIGDGGAGKTSLVKRLLGTEFDENEPQTHGINVDDFNILSGGNRIKIHFWDFGGQEIMHATHQFFLSKRSAYVLVLDGRKDEKTEYWLKHIEAFGGDSPVLVVINKTDQNPSFDVNRRFLSEKYPSIKGFFRVSCSTNVGIDLLEKALSSTLKRIDHIKTMWAASWFNVKEHIELMREDFISYSAFRAICALEGVEAGDEQEILVDFLHDLGVALRFSDLPLRDTNVINPRWLTEGVYRIMDSEIIVKAGGVLRLELLTQILDQRVHPPEKHNFIIELMKKFELCYEIDRNSILLPTLLPIEEPKLSFGAEDLVRFFIDYDFLPKSIMPRFIVRMHNDIYENLRWRTGVVLQNGFLDARAVVVADEVDRRIEVTVYGSQRRDYLGIVLHALQGINDSFEKIRFSEKVPMPDRPDVTISYYHLLRLEARGIRTYMPDGTEKEYDVQELLGYVKPAKRSEDEILELLRELRDFNDTEATLLQKVNKSFLLQPNFFGLGVNINELIRRVVKGKGAEQSPGKSGGKSKV